MGAFLAVPLLGTIAAIGADPYSPSHHAFPLVRGLSHQLGVRFSRHLNRYSAWRQRLLQYLRRGLLLGGRSAPQYEQVNKAHPLFGKRLPRTAPTALPPRAAPTPYMGVTVPRHRNTSDERGLVPRKKVHEGAGAL